VVNARDVTDSKSASEYDGIRQFFRNPKSDGYLKSDRDGFEILVSVQLKNVIFVNNHCGYYSRNKVQ